MLKTYQLQSIWGLKLTIFSAWKLVRMYECLTEMEWNSFREFRCCWCR